MKPASPYRTAAEAAAYLNLPTVGAFYKLRSRMKAAGTPIKAYRMGERRIRFKEIDLERMVAPERRSA